jgi:dTDP-4-amino-4,6-dideoxygalactose transaminase
MFETFAHDRDTAAAFSFYKGRDAIEYALRMHGIGERDAVLTQGFSCHAVPAAMERARAVPVYADIDAAQINPTSDTLQAAYERAQSQQLRPRAVLIQHTLGYPADMPAIQRWCRERELLLIEDLAQSYGATVETPAGAQPVGSFGDCVVLSFGRDKVIDGVSGGGLVVQRSPRDIPLPHIGRPRLRAALRDMLYPMITWKIRKLYPFGIGKALHAISRELSLLGSPIASPTDEVTYLPLSHARLIFHQLEQLPSLQQHRRARFAEYQRAFEPLVSQEVLSLLGTAEQREGSSALRLSVRIHQSAKIPELLFELTKAGYHLSDRWYRCAVDSGSLDYEAGYSDGTAPAAEKLATQVMNFPTHQHISFTDVERIARITTKVLL